MTIEKPIQDFNKKDSSAMVRAALARFKHELELKNLNESAALYTELYEGDSELQELTEMALDGWPERQRSVEELE